MSALSNLNKRSSNFQVKYGNMNPNIGNRGNKKWIVNDEKGNKHAVEVVKKNKSEELEDDVDDIQSEVNALRKACNQNQSFIERLMS